VALFPRHCFVFFFLLCFDGVLGVIHQNVTSFGKLERGIVQYGFSGALRNRLLGSCAPTGMRLRLNPKHSAEVARSLAQQSWYAGRNRQNSDNQSRNQVSLNCSTVGYSQVTTVTDTTSSCTAGASTETDLVPFSLGICAFSLFHICFGIYSFVGSLCHPLFKNSSQTGDRSENLSLSECILVPNIEPPWRGAPRKVPFRLPCKGPRHHEWSSNIHGIWVLARF
jgi:hypothetical protein